jgi:hypothetical protein
MTGEELIKSGKADILKGISDSSGIMYFRIFKFLNVILTFISAILCIIWVPMYLIYMISESAYGIGNFLIGLPLPLIMTIIISLTLKAMDSVLVALFTNQIVKVDYEEE